MFFALLAVMVGLNVAWHATHAAPVITGHRTLLVAAHQLDELARDPAGHLWDLVTGKLSRRPDSIYNASSLVTVTLLGGTRGALLISTLYLVLLMAAVLGIVRRLQPGVGALAAVAAALCPAAVIWSRVFSPHIALMAVAAFGVYLLVRSEWLTRPLPVLAFALVAGFSWHLAETVGDALQLHLMLAAVAAYVFLVALIRPERGRLRPLLIALAAAALFVALIPEPLLTNVLQYGRLEGLDSAETRYAAGSLRQNPGAWLAYPAILWDQHLGPVLAVAVVVALAVTLRRPTVADGVGLAFFVVPLLVATLVSKKRFNYVFALLPGAAVIIGLAVGRLRRVWLAYALTALLAAVAVFGAVWQPFRADDPNARPQLFESKGYARYFQSAGEDQINPPRNSASATMRIVGEAKRLAQRPGGLRLLLLGRTFAGSHITALRAVLRLENAGGAITVTDPVAQLTDFCTDAAQRLASPDACEAPDVVVFFPNDQRQRPFEEFARDPETWRALLSPANECTRLATGDSIPAPEFVAAWSACLAALPWEKYRARDFAESSGFAQLNRGIVLDRPDRGITIDLPTEPRFGADGPLGPPPAPGVQPAGPPPHAD